MHLKCINVTIWFRTQFTMKNLLSTSIRYENQTFVFTTKPEADIRALTFLRSMITPSLSSCSPSSLIFLTRHHRRSRWISSWYWISKRLLVFEHPQRSIDRFRSLGFNLIACSRFLASNFIPLFRPSRCRRCRVKPQCRRLTLMLRNDYHLEAIFPKVANK